MRSPDLGACAASARVLFRFSRWLVALALVLVAASVRAADSGATPEGSDARKEEAKQHFERGLLLADTGQNWSAALEEFLKSRELYPTRAATRNAAIALRQLGRYVAAFDLYTDLLQEFGGGIPPEQAAALGDEMQALRAHIGEIELRCNETAAGVVVDGLERGSIPVGVLRLDAGSHVIHITKTGFVPFETGIVLKGGERAVVETRLERASASGTLAVSEADGAIFDVLVDGVSVGKTPWRGNALPGRHVVSLRSADGRGTGPSAALVRQDTITTLTLRAVTLDAALRVEPTPSSASVFIDGVGVGSGIWSSALASGSHRVEAVAAGHLPFRRDLALARGQHQNLQVHLERDVSSPFWRAAFRPHPFVEVVAGGLFASTFHGGADDACNCSERSAPAGFITAARAGYSLVGGLGIELTGGYLWMSESMVRRVTATGERYSPSFNADDYRDSTRLSGPMAALGASYRLLEKTPLTARAAFGLTVLRSATSNRGTFTGEVQNPDNPNERQVVSAPASIAEAPSTLPTPFGMVELRFGYRFSTRISADAGLGVLLLFVPSKLRVGTNNLGSENSRSGLLDTSNHRWANGDPVVAGVITLPTEEVAGTFATFAPTLGLRADF